MTFNPDHSTANHSLMKKAALLLVLALSGALQCVGQPTYVPPKPTLYLGNPGYSKVRFQGAKFEAGTSKPLSLVASDIDGDGVNDLVAGYATPDGGRGAIFRGNLHAFPPHTPAPPLATRH